MKQVFFSVIVAFVFASCSKTNDFGLANDDNGAKRESNATSNRAAGILIDPNGNPSGRTAGILIDPNGNPLRDIGLGHGLDPNRRK